MCLIEPSSGTGKGRQLSEAVERRGFVTERNKEGEDKTTIVGITIGEAIA